MLGCDELTVYQVIREVVYVDQEEDVAQDCYLRTPDVTGTVDDHFPSITTVCVRLVRKAEIQ